MATKVDDKNDSKSKTKMNEKKVVKLSSIPRVKEVKIKVEGEESSDEDEKAGGEF